VSSIAVMLVLAVLTLDIARTLGRSPMPLLLAEVSASNVGGAATFVGDPPNVILGTYFQLSFTDFLAHTGPPAVAALLVVLGVFVDESRRTGWNARVEAPAPSVRLRSGDALSDRPRRALALAAFVGTIGVLAVQGPLGIPVGRSASQVGSRRWGSEAGATAERPLGNSIGRRSCSSFSSS
jgi:Na+/H+ antiporter NhaD/arsenite permease-like protein